MIENNICFIDFETTGTNILDDFPIEIGAVLVDQNFTVLREFHSYIKPNNFFKISDSAAKIHGIEEQLIFSSPDEKTVLNEMFRIIGTEYRFAAWNMSFDVAFFKVLCQRNSFDDFLAKINYRHIDVQSISYVAKEIGYLSKDINSFSDIIKFFGLPRANYHSAIEDAKLLVQVHKLLIQNIKNFASSTMATVNY